MNWTKNILSSEILSSLGWTLIHSIWIGGIVFIVAWLFLYIFRNSKANNRYIISIGSLSAYLSAVVYTFFNIYSQETTKFTFNQNLNNNLKTISNSLITASPFDKFTSEFSISTIENYINDNIPVLVVIWLVGLTFFCFRFMGGLFYTYRLRSNSKEVRNSEFSRTVRDISYKIGLKSKIQVKESSFISTPLVIGFIKPIILLPLGMANGLSMHQVEAILFHEIAHIYRFDYLINLIQSLVEVVLFYHPVVWWLSAHIRSERENICDDIAIRHTGNALNYAIALTRLQELNNHTPDIVLAFSNKKARFMNRIRRQLGLPLIENNFIEGLVSSLVLIVTIILLTTNARPALAQADNINILNKENYANNKFSLQNDQGQDQNKKTNSKQRSQEITDYEEKLTAILEKDYQAVKLEQNKLKEIEKQNVLINSGEEKDQQNDYRKLYLERMRILEIEAAHIKKCQKVNATEHDLNLKKEKIRNLEKLFQIEHNKFMAIQEKIQSEIAESQSKIIRQQNMTKDEQKLMQLETTKKKEYLLQELQQTLAEKQLSNLSEKKHYEIREIKFLENTELAKPDQKRKKESEARYFQNVITENRAQRELLKKERYLKYRKEQDALYRTAPSWSNRYKSQSDIRYEIWEKEDELRILKNKVNDLIDSNRASMLDLTDTSRIQDIDIKQTEAIHDNLQNFIYLNAIQDGLIIENSSFQLQLDQNEFLIDGKKQSRKLLKKYLKLYKDIMGEKLNDDQILKIDY